MMTWRRQTTDAGDRITLESKREVRIRGGKGLVGRIAERICKTLRGSPVGLMVAWLGLSVAGLGVLIAWSAKPGEASMPLATWPEDSAVVRQEGKPTLVMVVHPQCSCSRASLEELARLMAKRIDRVDATVLFVRPVGLPDNWEKSDLWVSAAGILGVKVVPDVGGVEAKRFHAMTSGATLLFSSHGDLVFSGGITSARGHAGDSVGQDTIASILDGELSSGLATTPVYGCSLADPTVSPNEAGWQDGR